MATTNSGTLPGPVQAHTAPSIAHHIRRREAIGRVLVATDGSLSSDAAVQFAALLARERGAQPDVVSVVDPLPATSVGLDPVAASVATEVALMQSRESRLARVDQQVADAAGGRGRWPVHVRFGAPALCIAEEVRRLAPSLVVMGLRHRGALERVLRDDTTVRLMRRSSASVLALTPALTTLPKRIAVAVDFSRASLHAALAALALLADGGTLFLVHVQPRAGAWAREWTEGMGVIYLQGVTAAFRRLRSELRPPADVSVEAVFLEGDPAEELAAFAQRSAIDLIAVGSQRRSLASRMLLGSVTAALVRDARCSLLLTPPPAPRAVEHEVAGGA